MLGYIFLVSTVGVLEYYRQGNTRALWVLPPLFLVWINTHGSWIVGLGVIFIVWLCGLKEFQLGGIVARRWSTTERLRLELVFALCIGAIAITPYGTRLAAYPFMVATSLPLNVANILEWMPMPFNLFGGKVFLFLVLGFFLCQMILRFTCRLHELVLFVGGAVMAFLHVRFVLLFVPFFAPLLATILAQWLPKYDRKKEHYLLNAILMAACVAGIVRFMPTENDLKNIVSRQFPVRAVDYLRAHHVPRPMYNTYGYGGYLISAFPDQKVFIDGRGDLYEVGGAFRDYLEVANLKPAAFSVLRSYGIKSCLLDRKEPLATVLSAMPDWKQEYSDDVSALFVRRDAP